MTNQLATACHFSNVSLLLTVKQNKSKPITTRGYPTSNIINWCPVSNHSNSIIIIYYTYPKPLSISLTLPILFSFFLVLNAPSILQESSKRRTTIREEEICCFFFSFFFWFSSFQRNLQLEFRIRIFSKIGSISNWTYERRIPSKALP